MYKARERVGKEEVGQGGQRGPQKAGSGKGHCRPQ